MSDIGTVLGTLFLYPDTKEGKPIQFLEVKVLEWPSEKNGNQMTFIHVEEVQKSPTSKVKVKQIARSRMAYVYTEEWREVAPLKVM